MGSKATVTANNVDATDQGATSRTKLNAMGNENATRRYAKVVLSAPESIPDAAVTSIPWDTEVVDTDGFWTAGSPTIFTIPASPIITKVRLSLQCSFESNATGFRLFRINSPTLGTGAETANVITNAVSGGRTQQNLHTSIINVSAGDTFDAIVQQTSGIALDVDDLDIFTWFQIEVIE